MGAAQVHPTALVHPGARLAAGVSVGAYTVIGEHVEVGEGTWIGPHVVVEGRTRIGRDNRIYQFASVGAPPQDKKYQGEPTRVEIGDRNTLRENVTVNCGTVQGSGVTRLGNDNWIMAGVHFAHDCIVGSHSIFANLTGLAGHCEVGDWVILGGVTMVHQFVRIGAHSLTSMGTYLSQDLPPYVTAAGNTASPRGINAEGLRRRDFSADAIARVRRAYRTLYRSGLALEDARRELAAQGAECPEVAVFSDFVAHSRRGIIR
ncbi:MAG: acyl-ACP--UDP-N-acetylglucosamine O-acyltransferase [Burkholderiales bacterium]